MKYYYYIYGNMGMKSNGSFTRDKSKWIKFDEIEVNRITKPYGTTKNGLFIECEKF